MRRKAWIRGLILHVVVLVAALQGAQEPAAAQEGGGLPAGQNASGGERLAVHLLTMGPGDEIWERFGHNALWIHDAETGHDIVYNWGLFSFDQEAFLLRFLRGEMLYWMDGFSLGGTLREYEVRNRSVWAQELALTPEQRLELLEFAEWNRLPQNRHYRYDYFRDNCSTRVRDALDLVLDGALRREGVAPGRGSYRWHARRLVYDDPVVDRGMHILLGPRSDMLLSRWEEAFLPMELMALVAEMTVAGEDGSEVPLVRETRTLFEATRPGEPEVDPGFGVGFLVLGLLLGGGLALLSWKAAEVPGGPTALAVLGALWALFSSFFGWILVLGWLWTDHVYLYGNENLLQTSPLSLLLLPAFVAAVGWGRWLATARALALAILALSTLGLLVELGWGFRQENLDVIALALPAHAGVAWALFRTPGPARGN